MNCGNPYQRSEQGWSGTLTRISLNGNFTLPSKAAAQSLLFFGHGRFARIVSSRRYFFLPLNSCCPAPHSVVDLCSVMPWRFMSVYVLYCMYVLSYHWGCLNYAPCIQTQWRCRSNNPDLHQRFDWGCGGMGKREKKGANPFSAFTSGLHTARATRDNRLWKVGKEARNSISWLPMAQDIRMVLLKRALQILEAVIPKCQDENEREK